MTETDITPQTSVADLLERWPQAIPVFLQHRMSCVGCSMSAFETLEDAARIYHVRLDLLMQEISGVINHAVD